MQKCAAERQNCTGSSTRGGGALKWQEGVSGSSMDTQKAP